MLSAESEQGLERCHQGAAPVEAEGELVEVGLQVMVADAMMSAPEPGLEIPEDPMHAGQYLGDPEQAAKGLGAMTIAQAPEGRVGSPAVSHDEGSGFDIRGDEAREGRRRGVRHHLEAHPARRSAADLDRGDHQCLVHELPAAFQPRLRLANVGFIDLDLLLMRTLKEELLWLREWTSPFAELERALAAWIEWYNPRDVHSALGYRTPCQVEQAHQTSHSTQFVAA